MFPVAGLVLSFPSTRPFLRRRLGWHGDVVSVGLVAAAAEPDRRARNLQPLNGEDERRPRAEVAVPGVPEGVVEGENECAREPPDHEKRGEPRRDSLAQRRHEEGADE
eukprot:193492-Chlamydomonas_euryale.AAC.1